MQAGKANLAELRKHQLDRYLQTLEAASVYNRGETLIPAFRDVVDNP